MRIALPSQFTSQTWSLVFFAWYSCILSKTMEEAAKNWKIQEVIVQGLRESGVFSSVVSSAQESLSKDKFLASFESSNSSKAAASESLPSRKIGRNQHSQAARRILEESASHMELHEEAVPPLPSPGIDADVITEA
ncbi:hypothetical protein HAX54_003932 [Datura stramonium]|uniref:Uncharacterized protein n=1 Tax=Datura stramonium TaxID=4076 RepID=A0ABS8RTL1_DATST|nr:hypothetical protein [Datura stramonium]